MSGEQHLKELEEKYEDYKVYDRNGERIGKVDDLFIDETDREEYIGVKMGFFGLKSTLIPMEIVRVNEAERRIEVSETKDMVKDAPTFSDDDEIDATFEENIRRHFNLESGGSGGRGSYGAYAGSGSTGTYGDEHDDGVGTEDRGAEDRVTTSRSSGDEQATSRSSGDRGYEDRGYEGTGEQSGASAGESGSEQYRDVEVTQRGDASGDETSGETREASTGGSGTGEVHSREETVSEETGSGEGRPKVRRRIIREEIIEEDPEDGGR